MNFTLKIKKINVLRRKGCADIITVQVEGTSPFPVSESDPILQLEVVKNSGIDYVRNFFGIEPTEIIDIP